MNRSNTFLALLAALVVATGAVSPAQAQIAGCGRATLDKLGTTGHTNQYFTRVQWVY